ncbi:biotin carboxylase [Planomicrobium koreense]|uniref:Biotin carboxylase n=1 Tax=Planococcus koreensis TaxID=112331 RepID=A0A7W8CTH8_9BACL|nr:MULTISPECIES: ATP-grasp domain-containing protein [Planococcus]MBB5180198.1 biotin carboxylase [Planococcus koreensis]MDN3449991.1 ATP-grasp domain-containing protein [Planococcus sp. APC 3906]
MKSTKQKKILILSGIAHMVNVVETAKRMGYYTIVTDKAPGSPAKKVADKSYDISTSEIDRLAEMARHEQIDGVFNGFDDLNTWNALALCEKLGLPYYATEEQLEICSNKDQFKEHCRKFGVPVSEEYVIDAKLQDEDIAKLTFPVIIKPVDSYASQGITICYTPEELKSGYEKALDYSKSGNVIIERFIDTPYGTMMYYTVQNGDVFLSAVTDRHVHQQFKELPPLPIAVAFPSMHKELYLEKVDPQIRDMLKGMGIQNGVLMIQALYEEGEFFIYEMGFRISGSQHYTIVEQQTGINLLEMMLDHALGEPIDKYDISSFDDSYIPRPSCNLPILLDNGIIAKVSGLEKVLAMPQVLSFVGCRHAGDVVEHTGSYSPMFGRFNITADSLDELHETIDAIYDTLTITSTEKRDMILVRYQPKALPVYE